MRSYAAADVRAAEEPLLAAGAQLMANAALAVELVTVRELRSRRGAVRGGRVLALVGSGNNGGDGLFAAAGLARRGVDVTVLLLGASPHVGGLAAVRGTGVRPVDLGGLAPEEAARRVVARLDGQVDDRLDAPPVDVVLDAVTGIGVSDGLRGVPGAVVAALADLWRRRGRGPGERPTVVAVDVPSGIGVDDGALPGPVLPADVTVTMGAAKPGLLVPPAARAAGRIELVDLGLGPGLSSAEPRVARLTGAGLARLVAPPPAESDKYRRGVVGVLAGSAGYPGAAVLACEAAAPLAGMVRYLGPGRVGDAVLARRPEVVCGDGWVQAWALGSGVGVEDAARLAEARDVLARVLAAAEDDDARVPVVLDAGALDLVEDGATLPPHVVLTPHAGELARLLGRLTGAPVAREEVEALPLRHLREAVRITGATVLLKGSVTLVAGPSGPVWSQTGAPSWLATAGAGDVLAGVAGALLARWSQRTIAEPERVAEVVAGGALLHALAAREASLASSGGPIVASDVARALPTAVGRLLGGPDAGGPDAGGAVRRGGEEE